MASLYKRDSSPHEGTIFLHHFSYSSSAVTSSSNLIWKVLIFPITNTMEWLHWIISLLLPISFVSLLCCNGRLFRRAYRIRALWISCHSSCLLFTLGWIQHHWSKGDLSHLIWYNKEQINSCLILSQRLSALFHFFPDYNFYHFVQLLVHSCNLNGKQP